MDIDGGAWPGPVGIKRRWNDPQRPMGTSPGRIRAPSWIGGMLGSDIGQILSLNIGGFGTGGFSIGGFGFVRFGIILGFGGSVPVVVLVLVEQLEGSGGLGEDADGFGASHFHGVLIALVGEDVGDAVDGGFEPDGIPGSGSGDDEFQSVFGVTPEPDEPLLRGSGGLLFRPVGVGLIDGGV